MGSSRETASQNAGNSSSAPISIQDVSNGSIVQRGVTHPAAASPFSPNIFKQLVVNRSDQAITAAAGALAGFMSGVVTCPLDVIKTKLQAQGGFQSHATGSPPPTNVVYKGMLGTARVIWKVEGLKGLYRGLGPIILGYLPTWSVWFTVYGGCKTRLTAYGSEYTLLKSFEDTVLTSQCRRM
jgi:solute carrier family 25 folate transporter 32